MVENANSGIHVLVFIFLQAASTSAVSWLPTDNQLVYELGTGETKRLELNTTHIAETPVYITVSPCSAGVDWAVYKGAAGCTDDKLRLLFEYNGEEAKTFSAVVSELDRYLLQLSSKKGGAAAISVRGEAIQQVRLRVRAKSKRKLTTNWEPSPVDPQATIYCLVASHKKKYTSLCAAQSEAEKNKDNRKDDSSDILDINPQNGEKPDDDNVIPKARLFDLYEGKFINHIRRKKFTGRSTKATDEDPVVACVGGRSHHLIENLDLTKSYYVTLFGVGDDRRAGSLLAWAELRPRTSTAKRLKQNQHYIIDLKGRTIFYYKAASNSGGLWLAVSTCGGAADLEVSVRGKRLRVQKNIDPYAKIFVPAPSVSSSIQETSDEDSVQVDSGSEESRVRYVIKLYPSWRDESDSSIRLELLVSPSQWGANTPELAPEDGASVREIRPYRSCKSLQIAFLPATHQTADTMRYCVIARESPSGDSSTTCSSGKRTSRTTCITQALPTNTRVIMQKITGLKAGKKYAIQVTASTKNFAVPYNILYADTNASCKNI